MAKREKIEALRERCRELILTVMTSDKNIDHDVGLVEAFALQERGRALAGDTLDGSAAVVLFFETLEESKDFGQMVKQIGAARFVTIGPGKGH